MLHVNVVINWLQYQRSIGSDERSFTWSWKGREEETGRLIKGKAQHSYHKLLVFPSSLAASSSAYSENVLATRNELWL